MTCIPAFQWGSCYSIFSFMCMFCRSLFALLYFCTFSFDLLRFTDSDNPFGIFKLFFQRRQLRRDMIMYGEDVYHYFFTCPNYTEIRLTMMNNLNWIQTIDLNLLTCGSDDLTHEENINIFKHVFNFIKFREISCNLITR